MLRRSLLSDGGSLPARLIALVLLPLVGCAVLAGVGIARSVDSFRAASRADNLIRSALAVDKARGAFQQEIVPGLSVTAIRKAKPPKTATDRENLRALDVVVKQLPGLRDATDRAVLAMAARTSLGQDGQRLSAQVSRARATIDDPTSTSALMTASTLTAAMADSENGQIALARREGLDAAQTRALQDVQLLALVNRVASEELAAYTGAVYATPAAKVSATQKWATSWAEFASATRAVADQASPAVISTWTAANAVPSVREYNDLLTAQLTLTKKLTGAEVVKLIAEDGTRNNAYAGVLSTALAKGLAAAHAQQRGAAIDLAEIVIAALLLVVASVAVATWVWRSITRPLARLADQATLISRGELTDVAVGGPREVRTVARALSSSVVSLRNIEAHAAAVAAGDLESSALQQPLPGPLGEVVHSSVARIIAAINDREAAQRELAHLAAHDALTELPNRPQALKLIEQALYRGQRSSAETALMFIDLDAFKAVNDTFGHAAGDQVLQTVAQRLLEVVRDGDSVARLGGDEFVVLVEGVDDEADIVKLGERIVEQISTQMTVGHRPIHIGASVGIAFCRDGYVDADRLLHEADSAVYRAKRGGRGQVAIFDDGLRAELSSRAELEQAIAAGLEHGEFFLLYQPVVDLTTRKAVGVEALIRWNRPGHGVVVPADFIPVAERSTLINDIGRWVLGEATTQLARWDAGGQATAHLQIAVNVAGNHLTSRQLVNDVAEALAKSGLEPHRLIIEMTETVFFDDVNAIRHLQELRAMGVKIAIDDFGTGFTSIGQLPRLKVDILKIDRRFVGSLDAGQQELVRLIVASAHAFGLIVIGEGVEQEEQAKQLHGARAEYGQGFLFARPQPAEHLFPPKEVTAAG